MESMEAVIQALGGIQNLGPIGILGIFVFSILMGKLIPERTVESIKADREQWKQVALTQIEINREQGKAVSTLMETGRTVEHVMNSLPQPELGNPAQPEIPAGGEAT